MATPTITLTPEQSMAALQRLLNGPAATPPAGVTPDFDDPPNQRLFVIAILVLCLTFSTLAVLMRMYTKLFLVRSLVPEDCECLFVTRLDLEVLTFSRHHCDRMGKLRPNEVLFPILTMAAVSDCAGHTICAHPQIW